MPAEYEKHEAVWLGWEDFPPYHQPFFDIARVLSTKVQVKVVASDSASLQSLKQQLIANGLDPEKFRFYVIPDNRYWMRDHGAAYVVNGKGEKKVVDFGWSLYGVREWLEHYHEGNADSVAQQYEMMLGKTGLVDSIMGAMDGWEAIKTDVVLEGGSIEVNGKGTLIQSESVTLQRNPGKSREYIESELKRVLGVSNIIWLKNGLAEDGYWWNRIYDNYYGWGVSGHTDEFVRFVNDTTVLLAWVDEAEKDLNPINRINYERMSENLRILEAARDQDGHPLRVIRFPLPDPLHHATVVTATANNTGSDFKTWTVGADWGPAKNELKIGEAVNWVPASSYLNYLVTNDLVLMSTYVAQGSSPEKEARAVEIIREVFPGREVVLLEVMNINFNGGGIHCSTQQEPGITGK